MGSIKFDRESIKKNTWYAEPKTLALWVHLLLGANEKDEDRHGEMVRRGQMLTSISKLSTEAGLTPKQTRLCLERLEKSGAIAKEGSRTGTKITTRDFDTFQGTQKQKKETCRTANPRAKTFVPPSAEEVRTFCFENGYTMIDAEYFVRYYEQGGWVYGKDRKPIVDWKATVRQWAARDRKRQQERRQKGADKFKISSSGDPTEGIEY